MTRFIITLTILVVVSFVIMIIGVKKQWDGKKSFLFAGPVLVIIIGLFSFWVMPTTNLDAWKFRLVVTFISLISLYILAKTADKRWKMKKR